MGSVTVQGNGPDVTELRFAPGISAISINFTDWSSSTTIENLSITTKSANEGTAITLNQINGFSGHQNAQTNLLNVTLRGSDGYANSHYWNQGVNVFGVRFVNFTNLMVYGGGGCVGVPNGCYSTNNAVGVNISGTKDLIPVQFNFVSCAFNYLTGIIYGPYAQGIIVQNSTFLGGLFGIVVHRTSVGADQLTVSSSNFNVGNTGIQIGIGFPNITITNNTFLVAPGSALNGASANAGGAGAGIELINSGNFAITGNSFQGLTGAPNNNNGIIISQTSIGGVITGNSFVFLTTPIWLKAATTGVNVQSNHYYNNSNIVLDEGNGNNTSGKASL